MPRPPASRIPLFRSPAAAPPLALDLTLLAVVGVVLAGALAAGGAALYREFYSPSAFVERYLGLLAQARAADALAVPGVAVDSAELEAAGLPAQSSEALLRGAALAKLTDVEVVSETSDGDTTAVTVEYKAGPYPGRTTFEVERDGTLGVVPTWRFARSPLAVVDLEVLGSMKFDVNGFTVDKRQVSVDGADADPAAPLPLLVFSPGVYSVSVDTAISSTPGVAVLSDSPLKSTKVSVQAEPTEQFIAVVQQKVDEFLTSCATQEVLLPTACPFGYPVEDRIASAPKWSIVKQPAVSVAPDGANWSIPTTEATAHIEVDIRSLFDGAVRHVSENVPFLMNGTITVTPDGSASIVVSGTDTR
ncbi:hypothetical protein G5T42_05650 [Microbacterium sp. 4R-513]|uniref:hypothetical protein n=1 Tax=Microbacterium sp. 4R-513 TaxID=2567934 RepID=UPI0013E170C3|nr:hypothetical protein [Microbacterium sp. 4R-513]QIG39037.1 hypothetical protein G5T42_05650 [Microbacterium sp. 4R-513]